MSGEKTVFVVEDNGLNRISLETILEDNDFNIVGSYANAEEAWEALKNTQVDIVLIDINLAGDKDGLWLGSKIRKHNNMAFVYLTAYGDKETINKVKKTQPNGYLMKPYNEPTLLTTIDIAINNFTNYKKTSTSIYIKDNYVRVKLILEDINYIQSDGNYLHVFLDHKKHMIRAKLSDFLEQLPETLFTQVHQRYVINFSKVDLMGNGFVMISKEEIPVSRRYKARVEKLLTSF
ncbi:response regulator [Flavobacteriaceae bacterium S356]|uniref:Response regulator n=1 Tax=Asprobacillus argus TaxID=3076534 RepID=A0ABU3LIC7_9FLAO|nr:response regulator [Flavobacteriaceae bacterium S356]